MSGAQIAILCGLMLGAGVVLAARAVVRSAPDLGAALQRLDPVVTPRVDQHTATARERFDWWAESALVRWRFVKVPGHDLAMLEKSRQWYAARKMTYAAIGGLYVLILAAVLMRVWGLSVIVPVAAVAVGAALGFLLPDASIRRHADKRRGEMRRAISSYIDLVALARLAGSGGAVMLERPADIAEGWAFRRIRAAISRGRYSTQLSWDALRELGLEADISELVDLAATASQAGERGDPVATQLFATARQLRGRIQQDAEKEARKAATEVWIPASLMVLVFLLFLIFPFASRL